MPRVNKNANQQAASCNSCAGGFHEDVCCPEPYAYKYKYFCKACPGDFRIWREKTDCPCCPAPYEYEYTVRVRCVPGKCERDDDCPKPQPQPQPQPLCPTKSSSTDSFPTNFSNSTPVKSCRPRRHRRS